MFKYCPACASQAIRFEDGKVFRCADCGFVYYHNIAAAVGCVISVPPALAGEEERLLFLVRAKEPAKGKLDLPGGFVDPGEGALSALSRELREELGWAPEIPADAYDFFASFPNEYPYKGILYNTCDMFFYARAPGLGEADLTLQKSEIAGARFLRPSEICFEDMAFDSTSRTIKAYLALKEKN
ncbi:MAG: NUDIX domain-containing protein [Treponema sp.]|nr:NUDIX domain-containing protein [Treponema sp.]